ncbi:MAG: cyanophycinase [Pseudomonadota bacterium]|jgi:cyanophycinase
MVSRSGADSSPSWLRAFTRQLVMGVAFTVGSSEQLGVPDVIAQPPPASADRTDQANQQSLIDLTSFSLPSIPSSIQSSTEEAVVADSTQAISPPVSPPVVFYENPRFFFGGGAMDAEALVQFWKCAGAENSRILVIGWGSTIPDQYFDMFRTDLDNAVATALGITDETRNKFSASTTKVADLNHDLTDEDIRALHAQFRSATAIFILGGDQLALMRAFTATKTADILRELAAEGVTIGGTSAGTAVGSRSMFTGSEEPPPFLRYPNTGRFPLQIISADGKLVDKSFSMGLGIGIIPDEVILDQHLKRPDRALRIIKALSDIPQLKYGIGVDDACAVEWIGRDQIQARGPGHVHVYEKLPDGQVHLSAKLTSGETLKLTLSQRQPVTLDSAVTVSDVIP